MGCHAAKEKAKKSKGQDAVHPALHPDWATLPYDSLVVTCQSLNLPTDGTAEALAARLSQHFAANVVGTDNRYQPYTTSHSHVAATGTDSWASILTGDNIGLIFSTQPGAVPRASVAQLVTSASGGVTVSSNAATTSTSSAQPQTVLSQPVTQNDYMQQQQQLHQQQLQQQQVQQLQR